MSTMIQGFAFGTGSSIAREAVGSVMGSGRGEEAPAPEMQQQPATQYQQQMPRGACAIDNDALMDCLKQNNSNAGACQFYFDALQQCQVNQ